MNLFSLKFETDSYVIKSIKKSLCNWSNKISQHFWRHKCLVSVTVRAECNCKRHYTIQKYVMFRARTPNFMWSVLFSHSSYSHFYKETKE